MSKRRRIAHYTPYSSSYNRVELSDGKVFEVEIYPDKTLYYDIGLFRTCVATYEGKHSQDDMVKSIADLKILIV